jgi:uncharacterized protein (TIGR02284 family)
MQMPGTLQDYAQAVHDVISINRDAEQGFRGAAQAVNDPAVKQMFAQYAAQRAQFAVDLQDTVRSLGFEAIDPQGLGGMLHASWMSLKGILTRHDAHAILVEAEKGEDSALKTYRVALSRTLTPEIAAIMQRQFGEIEIAHARIRALRDATTPPDDQPLSPTPTKTESTTPENEDVPSGI